MIVDSQSAKSSEGGLGRSFDANKRVVGRKRHVGVDTEGNLLGVHVTGAGVSDTAAGVSLLELLKSQYPTLTQVWADQGYKASFVEAGHLLATDVTVICRDPAQKGFVVLPRRWVVERFFAWISRARRLCRDFERLVCSAESMVRVAYTRVMLRRLSMPDVVGSTVS